MMKVRFSSEAKAYVASEGRYLRERSASGAAGFGRTVERARHLAGQYPQIGFSDAQVPIKGAHRIIVDDYLFDYDIIDGVVWIQNVRHSRNTPIISMVEDYEDDASTSPSDNAFSKK